MRGGWIPLVIGASSGRAVCVLDGHLCRLELPREKQWLSFRGRTLADTERLFDAGMRTDDTAILEFTSPVVPKQLQVLRAPPVEKGGKKDKKKKSKGGKTGDGSSGGRKKK